MKANSRDQKAKYAIKAINSMETVEAVRDYIADEQRQDVIDAANVQIEFIEKTTPAGGAPETLAPTHEKDTTSKWIKTMSNLQPKQGEVKKISEGVPNAGLKDGVVEKEAKSKIMTLRGGYPVWVYFDEDGVEIRQEKIQ